MDDQKKILTMLAGATSEIVLYQMQPAFVSDTRFSLQNVVQNWGDFERGLEQFRPDLLVVQGEIAPNTDALINSLARLQVWNGVALVILQSANSSLKSKFERVGTVRGVYVMPFNWSDLVQMGFTAVATERAKGISQEPMQKAIGFRTGTAVTGTRVISFISSSGGAGRSTIAENLGYELATRMQVHSLLMSFDLPATGSIRMSLHQTPNASEFFSRPKDGFSSCIQKKEGLDIIFSPDDSVKYALYGENGPVSVASLVTACWKENYAAVLLDLPNGENRWMTQGLVASNTVIIVTRCTLSDALATSHLISLLTEKMHHEVRIPRDAIFMVINHYNDRSAISARDLHEELVKKHDWAPPILDVIPYDETIPMIQDNREMPVVKNEAYAKHIRTIINGLYPGLAGNMDNGNSKSKPGLFGIFSK
jgi:cellulose biosynthesis protein BcsQ